MTNNGFLNRDTIANSLDLPTEETEVPQWPNEDGSPGKVTLKGLPAGDPWYLAYVQGTAPSPADIAAGIRQLPLRDDQMVEVFEQMVAKQDYPSPEEITVRRSVAAVILGALDGDGQPIFTPADAEMLRAKNRTVVMELAARIFELAAPEELEDAKKDSSTTPDSEPSTPSA